MDDKPLLHQHHLLFDYYNNQEATCEKCNQKIHGCAYKCESCSFWLQSACAPQQLPPKISHLLHSQHPLTLHCKDNDFVCKGCFNLSGGHCYICKDCNFIIDVLCAPYTNYDSWEEQGQSSDDRCVPIPPSTKHGYHRHALKLMDLYVEDDSGEYYCDICEEERNPKHPVYYCEKCKFVTHIQCAINKVDYNSLIPKLMEQEETEEDNAESDQSRVEIEHFNNQHPCNFTR
ncbi:hypothetical protein PTKIN_Ptkin01aG0350900 [Pterospermum kingtungense]